MSDDWDGDGGDNDDWGAGDNNDDGWGDEAEAGEAAVAVATVASDNSWKVRRSAVSVLSAFIRVKSDILKTYYNDLMDHLVSRFKERDTAVKEEILICTRDLLREAVVSGKTTGTDDSGDEPMTTPVFLRTRSSFETLDLKVQAIITG
jgi:hypothetical protein